MWFRRLRFWLLLSRLWWDLKQDLKQFPNKPRYIPFICSTDEIETCWVHLPTALFYTPYGFAQDEGPGDGYFDVRTARFAVNRHKVIQFLLRQGIERDDPRMLDLTHALSIKLHQHMSQVLAGLIANKTRVLTHDFIAF